MATNLRLTKQIISKSSGNKEINKYKKESNVNKLKFDNRIGIINNLICMCYFFTWFWILGTVFGINKTTGNSFAQIYFNIHGSQVAQLSSYFLIFDLIAVFAVGFGLLNSSLKNIFCGAILINIMSCIGLLFARNNTEAIMCACCYGFGGGICVLPMLNLSSQWFSRANIGKAISLTIGGALSGSIFARLAHSYFGIDNSITGIATHNTQSGLPLVVTLIFLVLIFVSAVFFLKEKKSLIGEHSCSLKTFTRNFIKSALLKENWIVILFITLINLPVSVLLWSNGDSFVSAYYNKVNNKSVIAGWVMIVLMFGNICGSFIWGVLTDKLGKRKHIMIGCALTICLITYLTMVKTLPLPLLFIIFFLIGFLCASQNIGYPMLAEQNASKLIGVTFIFNSIILLGGGAIVQQIFAKAMPSIAESTIKAPSWDKTLILPILMTVPLLISFFIVETGLKASPKAKNIIEKRKARVELWLQTH